MTRTTKTEGPKVPKVSSQRTELAEAAAVLPQQTEEGKVRAALLSAKTPEQYLAAADQAARYVISTSKALWTKTISGRRAIGEALYGAYRSKLLAADPNVTVKAASDVSFTTLMTELYGKGKTDYEALEQHARPGPGKRNWSSLAEDYNLLAVCGKDDIWLPGYEAQQLAAERGCSTTGYISFARTAAAEDGKLEKAEESSQMRSAKTKRERTAAALAEQQRQAAARKAAADKLAEDAEKEKEKATNVATGILRHVAEHPGSNLVTGVDLTCAAAAALSASKLRELAHALIVLADRPTTEQPAPQPEELTTAAADEAAAQSSEQPAPPALAEQLAALQQQLASLASAVAATA